MATLKINASEKVSKSDIYTISPADIRVDEKLRGRHTPPTPEQIRFMAESVLDYGQREPIEARKDDEGNLTLTMGFTRHAAASLIRQGFTDDEGNERRDEKFRLRVQVVNVDNDTAFVHNIVENAHRNQTTAIDDAHNQQTLRDKGHTDAQITRLYGYASQASVSRLRKILDLESDLQTLIHEDKMPLSAGFNLLDVMPAYRPDIVREATKEDGTVSGSKVKALVRDYLAQQKKQSDKGEEEDAGKSDVPPPAPVMPTSKARTAKEMRVRFEAWAAMTGNLSALGKTLVAFARGEESEDKATEIAAELTGTVLPAKAADTVVETVLPPADDSLKVGIGKGDDGWFYEIVGTDTEGKEVVVNKAEGFKNGEEARDAGETWLLNRAA